MGKSVYVTRLLTGKRPAVLNRERKYHWKDHNLNALTQNKWTLRIWAVQIRAGSARNVNRHQTAKQLLIWKFPPVWILVASYTFIQVTWELGYNCWTSVICSASQRRDREAPLVKEKGTTGSEEHVLFNTEMENVTLHSPFLWVELFGGHKHKRNTNKVDGFWKAVN